MKNDTVEAIGNISAKASILTGASTGIWGLVTSSGFLGLMGLAVAAFTALVTWYYKRAALKLEAEERAQRRRLLDLQMEIIRETKNPGTIDYGSGKHHEQ